MPDAFTVLWTKERCRWLERVGDRGPLVVVFGGPHQSQPSIALVRPGDTIFPIFVADRTLYVIGSLTVREVMRPELFVRDQLGIERPETMLWDQFFGTLRRTHPSVGHRVPITCADHAAVGDGSEIRFDRRLPRDVLQSIRLGPDRGRERPPAGLTDEGLKHHVSFQGHVRRLCDESAVAFTTIVHGTSRSDGSKG